MSNYKYQTLQVNNRTMMSTGPSARGQATAGAVQLLHKASVALNKMAVSYRVNKELKKKESNIDDLIKTYQKNVPTAKNVGCLVEVGIQEWAQPDFTGTKAQVFLYLYLIGTGVNPKVILQKVLSTAQLRPGAPRGWVVRTKYIWVTK